HRVLPSFPPRRSSDLPGPGRCARAARRRPACNERVDAETEAKSVLSPARQPRTVIVLLGIGFLAGVITAISPCVLPVLPILLARSEEHTSELQSPDHL